jgi:hypothetical protein
MGFGEGLQQGLAISRNGSALKTQAQSRKLAGNRDKRAEVAQARKQRQLDLTNKINYGVNADGSFDARGQMMLDNKGQQAQLTHNQNQMMLEQQKLQQQLIEATQKNQELEDRQVTVDMTTGITQLAQGNFADVDKILTNNPALKQRLAQIGITDIAPVDWARDKDLYGQLPNFNVEPLLNDEDLVSGVEEIDIAQKLKEKQAKMRALDGSFFKARNKQGKWVLHSTEELIHRSNTKQYMTTSSYDKLAKVFQKRQSILKGTVISDEELELKAKQAKASGVQADLQVEQGTALLDKLTRMKEEGATSEEILSAIPSKDTNSRKYTPEEIKANEEVKAEVRLKTARELRKIKSEGAVTYESIKLGTEIADKIVSGEVEPKDTDMKLLKEIELNSKNIEGNKVSMEVSKNLNKSLKVLDVTDKAIQSLKSLAKTANTAPEREFIKLSKYYVGNDKDTKEKLDMIKVSSTVGMVVARFIKSMSGTAVTESERAFLTTLVQGGNHVSTTTMMQAINEFRKVELDSAKVSVDSYKANDFLYSYVKNSNRLKKYDYELTEEEIVEASKPRTNSRIMLQDAPPVGTADKQLDFSSFGGN